MIKQYQIETPDQLKELNQFAKDGNANNLASIWSAKLRKDGVSPWDGCIFAIFDSDNGRRAFIGRKSGPGMLINTSLKYTPSLKWCEDNLKRVDV